MFRINVALLLLLAIFSISYSLVFLNKLKYSNPVIGRLTLHETKVDELETENVIQLTQKAKEHLSNLKKENKLFLRMGVRSGGCSGMSYVMDIISEDAVTEEDHLEEIDDIKCVIDPKSLLYLYGLRLDYSSELIGGGFKFSNPNAETSWYVIMLNCFFLSYKCYSF